MRRIWLACGDVEIMKDGKLVGGQQAMRFGRTQKRVRANFEQDFPGIDYWVKMRGSDKKTHIKGE